MSKIAHISRRLPLFLLVAALAVQSSVAGVGHFGRTADPAASTLASSVVTELPGFESVLYEFLLGFLAPFLG